MIKDYFKSVLRTVFHPAMYRWAVQKWHKLMGKKSRDWKFYLNDPRMDKVLKEMMLSYERDEGKNYTSDYWKELNNKNISQLIEDGFENFKQTVALNYFTWLLQENDEQMEYLRNSLPPAEIAEAKKRSAFSGKHLLFSEEQSRLYNYFTFMLWEFTKRQVRMNEYEALSEPLLGNPPAVKYGDKLISQDLANSILEYEAVKNGVGGFQKIHSVLEIGAGYGRTAYVVISLNPGIKYIIADVPPALYVSQKYLSGIFPGKKIFKFRPFDKYSEIEKEYEEADIIFLMPSQLPKIGDQSVDLCLAIDCLHEMLPGQIECYFKSFNRIGKIFYFKCWKKTMVPYDNIELTEKSYPVYPTWQKIFWRDCKVQAEFFEAMFNMRAA